MFTDGNDTASLLRHDDVLAIASRTDIVIYAAVAGLWGRASGLEPIVEQTGGSVHPIDSSETLVPVFVKILKEFRERYLLSYEPTGVVKGGLAPNRGPDEEPQAVRQGAHGLSGVVSTTYVIRDDRPASASVVRYQLWASASVIRY